MSDLATQFSSKGSRKGPDGKKNINQLSDEYNHRTGRGGQRLFRNYVFYKIIS